MATSIDWIKCSEDLPKKSGRYLALIAPGHIQQLQYSVKHGKWNAYDEDCHCDYAISTVEYWAEPNYPKGFEGVR